MKDQTKTESTHRILLLFLNFHVCEKKKEKMKKKGEKRDSVMKQPCLSVQGEGGG